MAIVGTWTIYLAPFCGGDYLHTPITFKNDGTFDMGTFLHYTGKWVQTDGMILFQFDGPPKTTYGGNIAGNAIVGIQSNFEGVNGCWYAIREGSTIAKAEERKQEFDPAGNKAKQ